MRRIFPIVCLAVLLPCLLLPARAAGSVQNVSVVANVSANATATVTMQLLLYLDAPTQPLHFPVPENASRVYVNGSRLRVQTMEENMCYVDISHIGTMQGLYSLQISFQLTNMVLLQTEDLTGAEIPRDAQPLILTVPLLSGIPYPVSALDFTITLPGEITAQPVFYSGYYQSSIASSMTVTQSGSQITGSLTAPLKGNETLRMEMPAEEMFPGIAARNRDVGTEEWIMGILAGIALVYWLVFLRTGYPRSSPCALPPEGITAGQVGAVLTGQGTSLSLMVLSWAQMGYLLIHYDENGRVLLHKRMAMGNERSAFENRIFRTLFGRRGTVDGTGPAYARLSQRLEVPGTGVTDLFLPTSGNPTIFRVLFLLIGLLAGVSLGVSAAGGSLLSGLAIVLFALITLGFSQCIQWGVLARHILEPSALLGLGCAALWLFLGIQVDDLTTTLLALLGQALAGVLSAHGGRRTLSGSTLRAELRGLRKTLRFAGRQYPDADYFFSLLPYAFALGVEFSFARSFGGNRLSGCPYLTTGMDGHLTAGEWNRVFSRVLRALSTRQKHLTLERLLGRRL